MWLKVTEELILQVNLTECRSFEVRPGLLPSDGWHVMWIGQPVTDWKFNGFHAGSTPTESRKYESVTIASFADYADALKCLTRISYALKAGVTFLDLTTPTFSEAMRSLSTQPTRPGKTPPTEEIPTEQIPTEQIPTDGPIYRGLLTNVSVEDGIYYVLDHFGSPMTVSMLTDALLIDEDLVHRGVRQLIVKGRVHCVGTSSYTANRPNVNLPNATHPNANNGEVNTHLHTNSTDADLDEIRGRMAEAQT